MAFTGSIPASWGGNTAFPSLNVWVLQPGSTAMCGQVATVGSYLIGVVQTVNAQPVAQPLNGKLCENLG